MILITKPEDPYRSLLNRLLLTMKLVVVLIFLNLTAVFAEGFAQRVTLKANNISLVTAMKDIQKQSGYAFFLNGKRLANIRVDVDIRGLDIDKAMNELLHGKSAEWAIENNTIVIKALPVQAVSNPVNISGKRVEFAETLIQQRSVTGTVTDAFDDLPIPGVSVLIAGTTQGTTTDANGIY